MHNQIAITDEQRQVGARALHAEITACDDLWNVNSQQPWLEMFDRIIAAINSKEFPKEYQTDGRECPPCGSHRIVDKYDDIIEEGYEKYLDCVASVTEPPTKG